MSYKYIYSESIHSWGASQYRTAHCSTMTAAKCLPRGRESAQGLTFTNQHSLTKPVWVSFLLGGGLVNSSYVVKGKQQLEQVERLWKYVIAVISLHLILIISRTHRVSNLCLCFPALPCPFYRRQRVHFLHLHLYGQVLAVYLWAGVMLCSKKKKHHPKNVFRL